MVKNHLSRLMAPRSWPIARKTTKWIARPMPGAHKLERGMPLEMILKDILKYAKLRKEVKGILNAGHVRVNGIVRKEIRFIVGLMDVISIEKTKENYRILFDKKGKFKLLPISNTEVEIQVLRINRKNIIKGGKVQLTFHNGRTILVESSLKCNVGESAVFDLKNKKIKDLLTLCKGALVYFIKGEHVGSIAKIRDILQGTFSRRPEFICELDDKIINVLKENVIVIGKDKPIIKLEK